MRPDSTRALLLIDDEPAQRRLISAIGARAGWRVVAASDPDSALGLLHGEEGQEIEVVLLDHWDAGPTGAALIEDLRAIREGLPILVLTAQTSVAVAVDAMRAGATDFLVKPIAPDRLLAALDASTDRRRSQGELRPMSEKIASPLGLDEIVGSAPQFRVALAVAAKTARSRMPVLIEGERGVGKDTLARAIHNASPRSREPFVRVNCGAVPHNLIDSELFGHRRNAFPGAFDDRTGRILNASGGTIFLDEISELPLETQERLAKMLESGRVEPVGGGGTFDADVRVIAASNRPLAPVVASGAFREDLLAKIAGVTLSIPPLRERASDIPALSRHLLSRIAEQPGMRDLSIADDALGVLMRYGWPGNVRQLSNALFRAAALAKGGALTSADFPRIAEQSTYTKRADDYAATPMSNSSAAAALNSAPGVTLYLSDGHLRPLDAIEADVIRLAIGHYRGRMSEVARRLGIGRSTLYRKLAELGIDGAVHDVRRIAPR